MDDLRGFSGERIEPTYLSVCPWCERSPRGEEYPICDACWSDVTNLDRGSLLELLAMALSLSLMCKRMSLEGWRILRRRGSQAMKLLQLHALLHLPESAGDTVAAGEPYPCPNCGAASTPGGDDLLCTGCRDELAALSLEQLAQRIGSAAWDGKFWQSALAAARQALQEAGPVADTLREVQSCLSHWTPVSAAFACIERP